ncbi:MAG TPA: hypothetical protein VMS11_04765 [Solirubrobacterales bacterium]|nr:hypothetical protein [Solirubrobacterales bacterium]
MNGKGIQLSWGRWSGFSRSNGECKQLRLGWLSLTFVPMHLDDLMSLAEDRSLQDPEEATLTHMAEAATGERRN